MYGAHVSYTNQTSISRAGLSDCFVYATFTQVNIGVKDKLLTS